jgi:hypothetical protein
LLPCAYFFNDASKYDFLREVSAPARLLASTSRGVLRLDRDLNSLLLYPNDDSGIFLLLVALIANYIWSELFEIWNPEN